MKTSLLVIALLTPLPALAAPSVPDKVETAEKPQYITDVTGKEVRLVGPRFYVDQTPGIKRATEAAPERKSPL